MFAGELIQGKVYLVKHTTGLIQAKFLNETQRGFVIKRTHYVFENLSTQRQIILKSKVKIRRELDNTSAQITT